MSETNPYLALMEDDEPKHKHHPRHAEKTKEQPVLTQDVSAPMIAPSWATTNDGMPVQGVLDEQPLDTNPYTDLFEDGDHETGLPYGAAVTPGAMGSSMAANAGSVAESLTGAPPGSVAQMKAMASQPKGPRSSGANWLKNWANMERPEFTGGVPEAGQAYQSIKPQGKVTSKNFSRFGNKPLHISGQMAQNELSALAAMQAEKQARSVANAVTASKAISALGKGVAGAGAGLGAYDAYRRFHEGDIPGAAVGALGTAASLAPLAVGSAGVLPALGVAAPLYLMAHDRIQHLKEHPEDVQLQNDRFDPLGMPIR